MTTAQRAYKDGAEINPGLEQAAALLREEAAVEPRPVDLRAGWDDVMERVAVRPSGASQVLWFFAAMATGVVLTLSILKPGGRVTPPPAPIARVIRAPAPHPTPAPSTGVVAEVEPEPPAPVPAARPAAHPAPVVAAQDAVPVDWVTSKSTVWTRLEKGGARLDWGRLDFTPKGSDVRLETRSATVVCAGRFAADVTEAGTEVIVYEGTAQVASASGAVTLTAGQQRLFPLPTTVRALEPLPFEQGNPACARASFDNRLTCLAEQAQGDGLKAQAALYERAWLLANAGRNDAAAQTLRESLERFPQGALHPEVRLALLRVLMAQEQTDAALAVARGFSTACPDDPRRDAVISWVATLEWIRNR